MQFLDHDFIWAIVVGTITLLILSAGFIVAVVLSQRKFIRAQRDRMEDLRASEQKYRNLFENSLVGMIRLSLHDWTTIEVNDAYKIMCADIRGDSQDHFLSLFTPDDQIRLKEELYTKGFVEHLEARVKKNDGTWKWISFSGRVFFKDGYIEGVVVDNTAERRAQEQIREQAALLQKAHDAVIFLGLDDRIILWNPGAERMYKWLAQDAVGRNVTELIYDPQEVPSVRKRRGELMVTGEWTGEVNQRRKDGSAVLASSHWTLVRDAEGNPTSILEIHSDITEKKLLESKFLKMQRLESLGILAGGIAHDLNNVLAPIILSVQILKKKWNDATSQKHLSTLETSAHRGANLVKQVLTFARGVEGERVGIQPEGLIREVFKIASQTFPRSIELESAVSDDLWSIVGDTTQLQQVLMNLCINAKDAILAGGRLSVSAENFVVNDQFVKMNPEAKPGIYVVIQVTDTGTGIPTSELDKIFEPFFTTKSLGKGTGLGLSTALGIVRSHRGFITVDSTVGTGTTFKVYLPAQLHGPAPADREKIPEYRRGAGETILLVDDEESVRETVRDILEGHGYAVLTANDGNQAIDLFMANKHRVRAVLTDVMMPQLDGTGLIKNMLSLEPRATVIAMTGLPVSPDSTMHWAEGVDAILHKPFTTEELLKVLGETMQKKKSTT